MKRIMCLGGVAALTMLAGPAQATTVFDMAFHVSDQWNNAPGGPLVLGADGVAGAVMVAPPPPGIVDVFDAFPGLFASPDPGVSFLSAGWVEFVVSNAPDLTYVLSNPAEVVRWDISFEAEGWIAGTPLPASASLTVQQDAAFQDMFGAGWVLLDGSWNAVLSGFPAASTTGPTYLSLWTQGIPLPGAPGYVLFASADPSLGPLTYLNPNGSTGFLGEGQGSVMADNKLPVPEPATVALLGLGLTGMLAWRRARM